MKRVAGFVELFTQKVPAVRAGHKKSTLTDSEYDENLRWTLDFLSFQNDILSSINSRHSESLGATHVALCNNIYSYFKYWWNVYARSPLRQYSFLHHTLEQEY